MARSGRRGPRRDVAPAVDAADAIEAVAQYAQRMHRLLGGEHGVCSPLGAWLLLALVGDNASDADRARLRVVLGCDPSAARSHALDLLREPHPDLAVGAACWAEPAAVAAGFGEFRAAISPPADTGPVPSQADADRWATERTLGLIRTFPIDLRDAPVPVLLATALATRISWREPYATASAGDLVRPVADGRFADVPLLRAPVRTTSTRIVDARFAVHIATSPNRLVVVSAIGALGEDPDEVLAVAQRTAIASAHDEGVPGETSLFDLPPGDGPAWRLAESIDAGTPERFETLLPAWEAASAHDLLVDTDLGFDAAGRAVASLLRDTAVAPEVVQAAVARYTRTGFEAAAVTAMAMRSAALRAAPERPVRTARVEFTHPFGVVAATGGEGPWRGLPVFSAWIAEPAT